MSAEVLRQAAALMRERAEGARLACGDEPWDGDAGLSWNDARGTVYMIGAGPVNVADAITEESALHIASWHPAVALAVADWLESVAGANTSPDEDVPHAGRTIAHIDADAALAVAHAYLGSES